MKGKTVSGARLVFHPEDPDGTTASGITDIDGTFTLVSNSKPGVEPGSYRVTVIWPDESKRKPAAFGQLSSEEEPPDLLNGRYALLKDTKLRAEIATNTTELPPFDLE